MNEKEMLDQLYQAMKKINEQLQKAIKELSTIPQSVPGNTTSQSSNQSEERPTPKM